jgi:valyl-tRNA synthetase
MRMRGKEVFYPVGWDDNGLPTERRAQNYFGVRCDPDLPYQPGLELPPAPPPAKRGAPGEQLPVSRRNFVELCQALTAADEDAFAQSWQRLGLSVDWDISYRTIDRRAQAISQRVFLADLARGDAYQAEGPALWDITFGTAVAQAETEDREVAGAYVRLAFAAADGREVVIATTRPELLPGCVALVAHPDDERYADLFGTTVTTPLFGVPVPVRAHRLAEPGKGTGIAMVCTFGDLTDVTWWRDLHLETRAVIGRDGALAAAPPAAVSSAAGRSAYAQLAGQPARAARRAITGLLRDAGALRGEPEQIRHPVKFYEKGDAPLEIVTTRQWYIRNGSQDEALRERLLARGRELDWHPAHMRSRFENWVAGLTGDWLVSRQRYAGVPVPVWYPVDAGGAADRQRPITPADADLPVDPTSDVPPGYHAGQRNAPGGFAADPDVLDTWATSSLTPQIAAGWSTGDDVFGQVFPMDLRPQAHEIIRTWLFYTVLRGQAEQGALPWRHAAISGWILDPDRKKMSKSAGNVVTPADLLRDYGADALRYWAGSARLGVDTAFDVAQLKIGRRLAVKILNATRFVLGFDAPPAGASGHPGVTEPIDAALLRKLAAVTGQCTAAFEAYDHALALEQAERFFWFFCDDYLELVKARAYGERGPAPAGSAVATLRTALSAALRLLAPFLSFATEEAWSWWQDGSVHRAPWPDAGELAALAEAGGSGGAEGGGGPGGTAALDAAAAAMGAVRRAKSQARLPMKAPVAQLIVTAPPEQLAALDAAAPDVAAAGHVGQITLRPQAGTGPGHEVVL